MFCKFVTVFVNYDCHCFVYSMNYCFRIQSHILSLFKMVCMASAIGKFLHGISSARTKQKVCSSSLKA